LQSSLKNRKVLRITFNVT